ncbi:MAG: YlbF family regulator [Lachnospiraceae bacterium]
MDQVEASVEELINAIKSSGEYSRYQQMREQIRQDPEKANAVNEFRKKTYLLQNNKANIDLFTEIDRLHQESSSLRAQPYVSEYLAAELALCRKVQYINYRLMAEIELD